MQSLDIGALPPRPAMVFHVGVSGHRALPDADIPSITAAATGLLREIRTKIMHLYEADQAAPDPLYRPGPPILSCVCGLAEGADSILAEAALSEGWNLVASLPFPRAEFARDFPNGPVLDRFNRLLAQSSQIFELDGDRSRAGEPYAQVGLQIVDQSDMMLVVWDGLPPRGPGGTGDVVTHALACQLPVAVLPAAGPASIKWHGPDGGDIDLLLQATMLPPRDATQGLHAYLGDAPTGAGLAASFVRGFEKLVLIGTKPVVPRSAPAAPAPDVTLPSFFEPADRLATEYAARYRAAGLMRYGLILPATAGAFIGSFGPDWIRPAGLLMQFVSLFIVVVFSTRGGWEKSQRRFLAYRALAEYLRNARLLLPLGAVVRPPRSAIHQVKAPDWTGWYGRAVVRSIGLPSIRIDGAHIATTIAIVHAHVEEQVAYLLGRAGRFTAIARRLRLIGLTLFGCGLGFEALRVLLVLVQTGERTTLWFNELALVLPAMAPVFLGMLSFGEYSRLATRYQAVAAELQAQLADLDRAASKRTPVLDIIRHIVDVMLAESADWQLLIKARAVSAY